MSKVMAEFYDGPHATPRPAEEGPIYLGIKNMTEDGHLDLSDIRHIAEDEYPKWTRRVEPRPGDVVFTYEASLHRYAIIPPGFRGTLGRRVALIRPNPAVAETQFLLYAFISPQWRRTVEARINVGSTVDRVPLVDFPNFPISLPPLPIQRKIAAILSAYDDLIANNTRRVKILEEMAQRVYHEWFVEFRYPGHEGVPLVESELGPIPQGWQVLSLSDVADATRGLSWDREQEVTDGGVAIITIPNVQERLKLSTMTHLAGVSDRNVARFSLRHGDVVLVGSNGNPDRVGQAIRVPTNVTALLASFLMRVRTEDPRTSNALLYMQLKDKRLTDQWRSAAVGATSLRNLRLSALRASRVLRPGARIEMRAQSQFEPLLALQDSLDLQSTNLHAHRDLLLPHLVSGEIDVDRLDIHMPGAA
jgi:type I restriction enzyme, S subunit